MPGAETFHITRAPLRRSRVATPSWSLVVSVPWEKALSLFEPLFLFFQVGTVLLNP